MNIKLVSTLDEICEFTDEGIYRTNVREEKYFHPYGSIDKIYTKLGCIVVESKEPKRSFNYAYRGKQKKEAKEAVAFANNAIKTAAFASVEEISDEPLEYRKKCNVCGYIFCYTQADIYKNKDNATMAAINSIGAIASSIGGTKIDMYAQSSRADKYLSNIVDYNRCPKCNSTDLKELSENELKDEQQKVNNNVGISVADELKKFKELLDMGAITQEEFDQKKKQLLGL